MLLPVGAAFGPLARTVEFRAIFTRTRKARTLLPAAFVAGSVKARLVEIARTIARGTGVALTAILTLLPRLRITAVCAKILAGATVGRTAREFLVPAKFSLRPVATGAIAIARRPGTEGPIATRTVAVFTKTFATRRIGPLLAAAFSRGIGLLVAKFAIGKTSSRACVVAITARRPVVAIKIRPVAARLERTRLATIIARAKILTRSTIPGVALAIPGVAIAIPGVALAISEIAAGAIIPVEALRTVAEIPARRTIVVAVALAGVGLAPTRIRLLAKRPRTVGLSGIGTPLAVVLPSKPALGELLFRPPRRPGAAFTAERPVTPAAGIVVFVVIAGHEWSLRCR